MDSGQALPGEYLVQAVGTIPGVEEVAVAITFDPPWTPDRLTYR